VVINRITHRTSSQEKFSANLRLPNQVQVEEMVNGFFVAKLKTGLRPLPRRYPRFALFQAFILVACRNVISGQITNKLGGNEKKGEKYPAEVARLETSSEGCLGPS
jgi:hypothetical protein